jgi:WD40 repeat-containing protein SMU1
MLQVFKVSSGKALRKIDPAHNKGVTCLAFNRDSTQLASASFDQVQHHSPTH